MGKRLTVIASATFAVLLWPVTAAADVIGLTEFRTRFRNDSFGDTVQAFGNNISAVGDGLSIRGGIATNDPDVFCALGCLGGQNAAFNFTIGPGFFGRVRIEDITGSFIPETASENFGSFTVRFDGGTIMLPPATLPPITSLDPFVGETFTLTIPLTLSGTATIYEVLDDELGDVLASATFESRARANVTLYTREPGVPLEVPNSDPNPCDKFGERCWVLARVDVEAAPVPEPATLLLLGTGLAGALGVARRKRKGD